MSDYEKELNLNKTCEELDTGEDILDTGEGINVKRIILGSIVEYVFLYFLFRWCQTITHDTMAFNSADALFYIKNIKIIGMDIVYFAIGLIGYVYSTVSLKKATIQNNTAKEPKDYKPSRLLKTGYYKKVRHPMYAFSIVLQAGFLLSLRSFLYSIAALIIIWFYVFYAQREEQKSLIPIFGDEYLEYKKETKHALFNTIEKSILLILLMICVIGFLF